MTPACFGQHNKHNNLLPTVHQLGGSEDLILIMVICASLAIPHKRFFFWWMEPDQRFVDSLFNICELQINNSSYRLKLPLSWIVVSVGQLQLSEMEIRHEREFQMNVTCQSLCNLLLEFEHEKKLIPFQCFVQLPAPPQVPRLWRLRGRVCSSPAKTPPPGPSKRWCSSSGTPTPQLWHLTLSSSGNM